MTNTTTCQHCHVLCMSSTSFSCPRRSANAIPDSTAPLRDCDETVTSVEVWLSWCPVLLARLASVLCVSIASPFFSDPRHSKPSRAINLINAQRLGRPGDPVLQILGWKYPCLPSLQTSTPPPANLERPLRRYPTAVASTDTHDTPRTKPRSEFSGPPRLTGP